MFLLLFLRKITRESRCRAGEPNIFPWQLFLSRSIKSLWHVWGAFLKNCQLRCPPRRNITSEYTCPAVILFVTSSGSHVKKYKSRWGDVLVITSLLFWIHKPCIGMINYMHFICWIGLSYTLVFIMMLVSCFCWWVVFIITENKKKTITI